MQYILLLVGFVLLVKGADYFVEGSASLAKTLKIPSVIIGLTIVAFGTSLPEASVSIVAALNGNNGIAIGNVVGSNLFNLLVIIGSCALLTKLSIDRRLLYRDFIFSVLLAILALVLSFTNGVLSSSEGVILFSAFCGYLSYTIKSALEDRKNIEAEEYKKTPLYMSAIYIIGGIIAIIFGGRFVVSSASSIASRFGLSDTLIGLTIVAVGTSLPELVTSFVATKKGETEIAIGNVVGSNIFNIGLILGLSASIKAIQVTMFSIYDFVFFIFSCLVFIIFAIYSGGVKRMQGLILLLMYLGYTVYIIIR